MNMLPIDMICEIEKKLQDKYENDISVKAYKAEHFFLITVKTPLIKFTISEYLVYIHPYYHTQYNYKKTEDILNKFDTLKEDELVNFYTGRSRIYIRKLKNNIYEYTNDADKDTIYSIKFHREHILYILNEWLKVFKDLRYF